jgi:hypothetical protein
MGREDEGEKKARGGEKERVEKNRVEEEKRGTEKERGG